MAEGAPHEKHPALEVSDKMAPDWFGNRLEIPLEEHYSDARCGVYGVYTTLESGHTTFLDWIDILERTLTYRIATTVRQHLRQASLAGE